MTKFCHCLEPDFREIHYVALGGPHNVMDYRLCGCCELPVLGTQTTHYAEEPTKHFRASDDGGSTKNFRADTLEQARKLTEEWVRGGSWGDESTYVTVLLAEYTSDDYEEIIDSERVEVLIEVEPEVPDCTDGYEHDWCSPQWLGGLSENPGVYSFGGTQTSETTVCAHCGAYRHRTSESTAGQLPRTPVITRYEPADTRSKEWIDRETAS